MCIKDSSSKKYVKFDSQNVPDVKNRLIDVMMNKSSTPNTRHSKQFKLRIYQGEKRCQTRKNYYNKGGKLIEIAIAYTAEIMFNNLTHRARTVCRNTQLLCREEKHIKGNLLRFKYHA